MPTLRLQEYLDKVQDLIRRGHRDHAVAHAQQILAHYPRCLQARCLLGEAYLEAGLEREAVESLTCVLNADPENLIARVGLGMLYAQKGTLPDAIWQMERALELSPGHPEVRRELGRLYARRDGSAEFRLKMTRAGLGRLYARNGLYDKAVEEYRAVLAGEADLPHVEVALAEALWRAGRRVEAVEAALDLLEKLPECLKANLILADIWQRSGQAETASERLAVARAVDPDTRMAQEFLGADAQSPSEPILVPELEEDTAAPYAGGPAEVAVPAPAAAPTADRIMEAITGVWSQAQCEEPPSGREGVAGAEEAAREPASGLEMPSAPPDVPGEPVPEWVRRMREIASPDTSPPSAAAAAGESSEGSGDPAHLEMARVLLSEQNWTGALDQYEALIANRHFLPAVIDDLKSVEGRHQEGARILRLLGDAYSQTDRLEEALEMYRRALRSLTQTS